MQRGRPQVWKTVPVQVLLSADPPFIRGGIVGFPSSLAVGADWYAPVQSTWGPLWIRLQLEAVGDSGTLDRLWGFLCWVKAEEYMVSGAHWGVNRSSMPLLMTSLSDLCQYGHLTYLHMPSGIRACGYWSLKSMKHNIYQWPEKPQKINYRSFELFAKSIQFARKD